MTLLKSYEVLGTDLPILQERSDDQLTFAEIVHCGADISRLERVGYVLRIIDRKAFYEPVYGFKKPITRSYGQVISFSEALRRS